MLLANLHHELQNYRQLSRKIMYLSSHLKGFNFSSLLFHMEEKQTCLAKSSDSDLKGFNFSSLLFHMEEKQTCLAKSSDSDIKKLVASAVPESTKKSTKYADSVFEESYK